MEPTEQISYADDFFRGMELSPQVMKKTLGLDTDHITPDVFEKASQRLLAISRGEQEEDDRDSMAYQRVYGAQDYIPEHIQRDGGRVARDLLWKATNKGSLEFLAPGALDPHVDSVFNESKLAMYVEGSTPFEAIDGNTKLTRIGEGGISSQQTAPDSMRAANNSFLGFVDPIRSPECYSEDTEVYTSEGWVSFLNIKKDTEFLCKVGKHECYCLAEASVSYEYTGDMYGLTTSQISFLVTPEHRMWIRPRSYMDSGFRFARIAEMDLTRNWDIEGRGRNFRMEGAQVVKVPYSGKVYCVTVPGGLLLVRRKGFCGFWCGNSLRVGLDTFMAKGVRRGDDGRLYTRALNARTGKEEWVDSETMASAKVATAEYAPGGMWEDHDTVLIPRGTEAEVTPVDRSEVDYYMHRPDLMFSLGANAVPFMNTNREMRTMMGSRYLGQTRPLVNGERPLVSTVDPDTGRSVEELIGDYLGNIRSAAPGVVTRVSKTHIDVRHDDGKVKRYELYRDFPSNSYGVLTNFPTVKAGDKVDAGALLANSTYTDKDTGASSAGKNLHVAFMPWEGYNYEDAVVVREGAAKDLAAPMLFKTPLRLSKHVNTEKRNFLHWKPGEFAKEQLEKLGDDGVVQEGQTVRRGDPLILAMRYNEPTPGTMGKALYTDMTEVWDKDYPGKVVDVLRTRNRVQVHVEAAPPLEEGDKLSGRYGNKGTVALILPDDQMPTDSKGRPLDLLLNPLGLPSRTNPGQIHELPLAKIAEKTGIPYKIDLFSRDVTKFVADEMKKHRVRLKDTVLRPDNGTSVPGIAVGNMYIYNLKHTADYGEAARGTGGYSMDETPIRGGAEGSKRLANLEVAALAGHGALEVIRDAKLIRGQENSEFWRAFHNGEVPPMPEEPAVYKKFYEYLRGAGINVQRTPTGRRVMPLTDQETVKLTGGREVKSTATFDAKRFMPLDGGLFGQNVFGRDWDQWGYIQLDEPLPNPVMTDPLRRVLRMTEKQFEQVVSGREELNGKTGGTAIRDALAAVDLKKETESAFDEYVNATKSRRDDALKRYRALKRMERLDIKPDDVMLSRIPVLPPKFRPIMESDGTMMVADPNYLYKQMLESRDDLREAKGISTETEADARENLYRSWAELTGIYDVASPKLKNKNVRGLLKWALGSSPKESAFQQKLFSTAVDTVARGVIEPDPTLSIDQIGLPYGMAKKVYRPFIIRSLSQAGYPADEAIRMADENDPMVRSILLKVMKDRPVMFNRAPTLHKLGIQGFEPVLTAGKVIRLSPSTTPGFGADFDGDKANVHVPVLRSAADEVRKKMLPSRNLIGDRFGKASFVPEKEYLMGLFLASRRRDEEKNPVYRFRNRAEARQALREGKIKDDTPIMIEEE